MIIYRLQYKPISQAEWERAVARITQSKLDLIAVGYEEMAIEDSWECLLEELNVLPSKNLAALGISQR